MPASRSPEAASKRDIERAPLGRPFLSPVLLHPLVPDLLVNALHRRPGDAEGGFLLARVVRMGGVGVVERFAEDRLRVFGQMRADGRRQIGVNLIGHRGVSGFWASTWAPSPSRRQRTFYHFMRNLLRRARPSRKSRTSPTKDCATPTTCAAPERLATISRFIGRNEKMLAKLRPAALSSAIRAPLKTGAAAKNANPIANSASSQKRGLSALWP